MPTATIKALGGTAKTLIQNLLDRWVLISAVWALVAVFLGYVALLPPQDRVKASPLSFADAFAHIIESNVFAILGWGLAGLVTAIFGLALFIQHGRIKEQGKKLAEFRDKEDPKRLSAGNREELMRRAKLGPGNKVH